MGIHITLTGISVDYCYGPNEDCDEELRQNLW